MKNLPRLFIVFSGILFFLLVCLKASTVFLSEIPFHQYRILQAQVRDKEAKLTDLQKTAQIKRLASALKWTPKNGNIYFEAARTYHRIALSSPKNNIAGICSGSGIKAEDCLPIELLKVAVNYYDKAIALNRFTGSARFWKLMARVSLDDFRTENSKYKPRQLSPDVIINELKESMLYEGRDPAIYRFAADLAFRAKNEPLAAEYYRLAFAMSLDGLESMVDKIALWESALDTLVKVVPETSEARMRLSNALAERWHFQVAKEQWEMAREMNSEPVYEDKPGNLVANGKFQYPFGSHFLDWKIQKRKGVKAYNNKGASGLVIDLDNAPESYFHLTQPIPILPENSYRFSAVIKPEGMEMNSESTFGFEVIHPFDFSLWSALVKCEIALKMGQVTCRGQKPNQSGYYTLRFDFTVPQPLRMVVLRFLWANNPSKGRVLIDDIRITRIEQNPKSDDDPANESIDYPSNEE